MLDDLSTGHPEDWRVTGSTGEDLTDRLSVVSQGSDGGPCLALKVPPEAGQTLRVTKTLRMPLPRQVKFRYRCEGEVVASHPALKILVEIRNDAGAVRDFLPETSDARDLSFWVTARADLDRPRNMVNVWSFYGQRDISELSLLLEGASGKFVLFVDRIELVTADEEMGPWVPSALEPTVGPGNRAAAHPPRIVYAGNNAGDLYETEQFLSAGMPDVCISAHPFRSLSYPPDDWPVSLADADLVVLTDFDTYVFSNDQLRHLADYVHGGGWLLVLTGPNSVARSLDRRALFGRMLPVEVVDRSLIHSASCPVLASASLLVGDVLLDHLGRVGALQRLRAKKGATVILQTKDGTPVLVDGTFGAGRVVVLNAWPDAVQDRGQSIFWSCCYHRLMGGIAARMVGVTPAVIPERVVGAAGCAPRIRFPYHKRAFAPGQEMTVEATHADEVDLHLWIVDDLGRRVDEVPGARTDQTTWTFIWTVPDLAEGRYRAMLSAGGVEEEVAIVCRRPEPLRLPVIARTPLSEEGLWHNVEGLRRMVDDLEGHGINLVAPPALGTIALEPYGLTAELVAWLELFAQERGMDVMYEYSSFGMVRHNELPAFSPYVADALERTRKAVAPQAAVADLVPRLRRVKTIDEPTVSRKSILVDEDTAWIYRERYDRDFPGEEEAKALEGAAALDYHRFLSDYVKTQFDHGYRVAHERERGWGLLHTFMDCGFGANAARETLEPRHHPRTPPHEVFSGAFFEDVPAWSNSGDFLDFDIYPYWYVESRILRFAKVHYGFAFMWAAAAHYDRPMGFYVELDERNQPFQVTPKEATGELAYTAIGEGCHYLNTFIYGTFRTGSMARPERWADGGDDLRAIGRTGPLIMASKRMPARAALYFPYDHWILSGERYFPSFAYELIRRSFGECDLLHQDIARVEGMAPYRIIALLGTHVLSEEDEARFLAFVEEGGVLLLDKMPTQTPSGETLNRLSELAGSMPERDMEERECGAGKVVKLPSDLDLRYWRAVEGEDQALRQRIEWDMRSVFTRTDLRPAVWCDDPEFNASLLDAAGASVLVVVNHRPEQAAVLVRVHGAAHAVGYACDLSTGEAYPLQTGAVDTPHQDTLRLTVSLTPRQGVLIGLFPEKPGGLSLRARQEGDDLVYELESGSACPVPVFIEAKDPKGRKNIRHSRVMVLREREEIRSSLAVNEQEGTWEIHACCPAAPWSETVQVGLSRP